MSVVIDSPFKRPECGGPALGTIRDALGGIVDIQIIGTDPHISGIKTGASITAITGNYSPPAEHKNPDLTFLIAIETVGTFFVSLADGTDFIITPVQSTAYLGWWYPARLLAVNIGTTGDFSVGW